MDYIKSFEQDLAYYFSEVLEKPLAKPLWIYLSLSHKCTYRCQMCGVVNILQGHELSVPEVKNTFDVIAGWGWDLTVVLTGGEIFLRNDIFEIIQYGAAKGLKIEAVSNGALITKDLADKIISSGLKNIAISLDGAKEETHDTIRQKGAFNKAITAIKNLVESKLKSGSGPQISVWVTIMRENVRELFDIIPLVQEAGVECLVYHPVIVNQDDMQNTSSVARFWLKDNDIELLKTQIDKIVDYQQKHGLVAFLHDPYMWIRHFKGELTKKDWKCNPFVFLNVGPDGDVRSCGAAFGNIQKLGLDECLKTKEADQARRAMKNCQKPCLQTCWANPQSDSLAGIVDALIHNLKKDRLDKQSKKQLLLTALSKLTSYEEMFKNA
ncbi:MAG: radical SAM protein [Candidatus Omnitrophica bacterium]|jgi:MoaA/NifB/PqqE/SkfB family radical SAM enzyme|nr:radical SAM protein [Candidatus Omnitrophota bacterium]